MVKLVLICVSMVLSGAMVAPVFAGFGDVVFQFEGPSGRPSGLCFDGQYICVVDSTSNIIYKYDPDSGDMVGSLILGAGWQIGGLGWDGAFFWMGEDFEKQINKINPVNGERLYFIDAPAESNQSVWGVAYGNGHVWSTNHFSPSAVYEQDPISGFVFTEFQAPGLEASGLAFDGSDVWIADTERDSIFRVSQTGTVETCFLAPGDQPKGLGFDGTYLWNVDAGTNLVYKIDISETGIEESNTLGPGTGISLSVYPNPFRLRTDIRLSMNGTADMGQPLILRIYDSVGRLVFTCESDNPSFVWGGTDSHGKPVASGVYFFRIGAGNSSFSKAAYLIK